MTAMQPKSSRHTAVAKSPPRPMALFLATTAAAIAVAACAHRAPPAAAAGPPPAINAADLPSPDEIPGVFTVRQKLVARSDHGGGSFEAVLQKQPGRLTLIGLTPYGARAFLLEQDERGVKFTSYLPRDLPFPPSFMLMDIHRVFDRWLAQSGALADGSHATVMRAENVREQWRGGRLIERSFSAVGHDTDGAVTTIMYEGVGPAGLAAHVTLTNRRFGYTLSVETLPI